MTVAPPYFKLKGARNYEFALDTCGSAFTTELEASSDCFALWSGEYVDGEPGSEYAGYGACSSGGFNSRLQALARRGRATYPIAVGGRAATACPPDRRARPPDRTDYYHRLLARGH
jgi:hypothetical protein